MSDELRPRRLNITRETLTLSRPPAVFLAELIRLYDERNYELSDDFLRLRRGQFFSPRNMTHAARSSTQASAVIVTFGKWVKARGAVNVFYRAEKKCRKQRDVATFIIISPGLDSPDRAFASRGMHADATIARMEQRAAVALR